jgi:hypothetical protein
MTAEKLQGLKNFLGKAQSHKEIDDALTNMMITGR